MTVSQEARRIGATELCVPPLGFGAAWITSPSTPIETAVATVKAAWENGVRLFDTAPWYGVGRSERRLGTALAELQLPRESFSINTKVGRSLNPEPIAIEANKTLALDGTERTPRDAASGYRVNFDYSYDAINQQHRDSLQRLGISRVNSLTLHDIDHGYHNQEQLAVVLEQLEGPAGGARALRDLKDSGQIDAIGMGCNLETKNAITWENETHEDLVERVMDLVPLDFIVIAGAYTLLETRALKRILPRCEKDNVSVIIASPFAGGWLVNPTKMGYMYSRMSGTDVPDEIKERTANIQSLCVEFDVPIGAVALQFVLAHPAVAAAIPGAANPQEANETRAFIDVDIPQEFWQQLRQRQLVPAGAPCPND